LECIAFGLKFSQEPNDDVDCQAMMISWQSTAWAPWVFLAPPVSRPLTNPTTDNEVITSCLAILAALDNLHRYQVIGDSNQDT